jgi:DNA-binding NarL/FixJ family response regulator
VIAEEDMSVLRQPNPLRVALLQSDVPTAAQYELEDFLSADPGVDWLGTLATTAEAIQALSGSRPAVVVADLRPPNAADDPGVLFRAIFGASPSTQIVAICAPGDESAAKQALAAGAAACLTRQGDPLAVLRAINDVMRGRMHLSPTAQRAIRDVLNPGAGSRKR